MRLKIESELPDGYEIDYATVDDVDSIVLVENLAQPSPWTRDIFLSELTLEYSHLWSLRDYLGHVVGYLAFWIVVDELHILNVVVHPKFHGRGLGRGLIASLMKSVYPIDLIAMTLEVRESNQVARNLYASFGFVDVGRRPGYYGDNGETAIVMTKQIEAKN